MQLINVGIGILMETNAGVSPGGDRGAGRISSGNFPQGIESLSPGSSRRRGTTPSSEIQPRGGSLSCTRFPHGKRFLPNPNDPARSLPAGESSQPNGFNTFSPQPEKSFTLRVASGSSWQKAVAAIRRSAAGRVWPFEASFPRKAPAVRAMVSVTGRVSQCAARNSSSHFCLSGRFLHARPKNNSSMVIALRKNRVWLPAHASTAAFGSRRINSLRILVSTRCGFLIRQAGDRVRRRDLCEAGDPVPPPRPSATAAIGGEWI